MLCSTFSFLHISILSLWAGICNTKWVINKKQTHIRHTSSSHNQMHMQTFNPYITSPPTEDTTVKPHTSICAYTSFHWSRYNVNRIKLVTNRVAYWPLTHGCFCFFLKTLTPDDDNINIINIYLHSHFISTLFSFTHP